MREAVQQPRPPFTDACLQGRLFALSTSHSNTLRSCHSEHADASVWAVCIYHQTACLQLHRSLVR